MKFPLTLALGAAAVRAVEIDLSTATIFSDCYAINGNGLAWSTTLSFLAEHLSVTAEQAKAENGTVYVHEACIIGGSSGAAVVGVWENLLKNEHITPHEITVVINGVDTTQRVYTPEDAEFLAKAMRFVAMGSDSSFDEIAGSFAPAFLKDALAVKAKARDIEEAKTNGTTEEILQDRINTFNQLVDKISAVSSTLTIPDDSIEVFNAFKEKLHASKDSDDLRHLLGDNKPNWWSQRMDNYEATMLFAVKTMVARHVDRSHVETTLEVALEKSAKAWWDQKSAEEISQGFLGVDTINWNVGTENDVDEDTEGLVAAAKSFFNVLDGEDGLAIGTMLDDAQDKKDENQETWSKKNVMMRLNDWARQTGESITLKENSNVHWYDPGQSFGYDDDDKDDDDTEKSNMNLLLEEPLQDGICTTAVAVLYKTTKELNDVDSELPAYDDARFVVACNQNTIEVILNSEAYQADVEADLNKAGSNYASKFVLVATERYLDALNFGIREPETFDILKGAMNSPKIRFTHVYDPREDKDLKFEIHSLDGEVDGRSIAVLGGFQTGSMAGVIQSYYTRSLFTALKGMAKKVVMNANRFLLDSDPTFALLCLKKYLSGGVDAEGEPVFKVTASSVSEAWENFDDHYDIAVPEKYEDITKGAGNSSLTATVAKINWVLGGVPASASQRSYIISPRAIPEVRTARNARTDSTVFVPTDDSDQFKEQIKGMCKKLAGIETAKTVTLSIQGGAEGASPLANLPTCDILGDTAKMAIGLDTDEKKNDARSQCCFGVAHHNRGVRFVLGRGRKASPSRKRSV